MKSLMDSIQDLHKLVSQLNERIGRLEGDRAEQRLLLHGDDNEESKEIEVKKASRRQKKKLRKDADAMYDLAGDTEMEVNEQSLRP